MPVWAIYATAWGCGRPFLWRYTDASEDEVSAYCLDLLLVRSSCDEIWAVPIAEPTDYEHSQVRPLDEDVPRQARGVAMREDKDA